MTEITAANLPGKIVGPKVAYLTDEFTNRDIFGVARGRCKEARVDIYSIHSFI
jgi:hypothetical protein